MSLLPLLRTAGALPLAQLNMRAAGSAQDILGELQALITDGLVTVEGSEKTVTEDDLRSSNALVKLTRAGTRRVFR